MISRNYFLLEWHDYISPVLRTVGSATWESGFVEPARCLYDHEFVVFLSGKGQVKLGARQLNCIPGSWFIVPPGIPHESRANQSGTKRLWVHFDWIPLSDHSDTPLFVYAPTRPNHDFMRPAPAFVPRGDWSGELDETGKTEALLLDLETRWTSNDGIEQRTCRALFLEVLLRLFSDPSSAAHARRADDLALKVKAHLDRMPPQTQSIQLDLESLGYSYAHLCRQFRNVFGLTPTTYLNALRIERAKALLETTDITVAEAAYTVGFSDPGYFARVFRKRVGLPPSRYRSN